MVVRVRTGTKEILEYLALSGGAAQISIQGPRLPLNLFRSYFMEREFNRTKFVRNLRRLASQGVIEFSEGKEVWQISLTEKGLMKVLRYRLDNLKIEKQELWDGLWRLIIFDIPSTKKTARDLFRKKLQELGLISLQESIFITPWPCRNQLELLKTAFQITPYVYLVEATSFDGEDKIRYKFGI